MTRLRSTRPLYDRALGLFAVLAVSAGMSAQPAQRDTSPTQEASGPAALPDSATPRSATRDTTLPQPFTRETAAPRPTASGASAAGGDTSMAHTDTSAVTSPSGVDSVVTFTAADSVLYHVDSRMMDLFGTASIRYKELGLDAERVSIDWNTAELTAHGVPDSSDTTGTKQRGLPILKDGTDTYNGEAVAYNFRTRKGRIEVGKTAIEEAWYRGTSIKKVDEDVLFVEDGEFTTCELPDPHYHFGSSKMKLIADDKIIARPVVMYIGDAPVMALPFGVFPVQRGRRSGLLTPSYGVTTRGRYISNLGYYWAINDYTDVNFRGDVYSKGGYTFFSDFRYALRYLLRGSLSVSFGRVVTGEPSDPDYSDTREYNLGWIHEQSFDPTTRLSANVRFLSSTYYQNTSVNLNNLLEQNIVSNVTFMKSWEGTPFSFTANMSRDQNLTPQPGAIELSQVLPGMTFTMNQTYPFRTSPTGKQWYDLIGLSYSGRFESRETKTYFETGSVLDARPGLQHQVNISASPKAGYITLSPFSPTPRNGMTGPSRNRLSRGRGCWRPASRGDSRPCGISRSVSMPAPGSSVSCSPACSASTPSATSSSRRSPTRTRPTSRRRDSGTTGSTWTPSA